MEYIENILDIKISKTEGVCAHFPNFIYSRYEIEKVLLDDVPVWFAHVKGELEQAVVIKKHIERIQKTDNIPVVLIVKKASFRQRQYLIKNRIAFIVEDRQIYLPFMGTYLQARCDAEKEVKEELIPSAQMLLLYFIYSGKKKIKTSIAARQLKLTATSVSRASQQLEKLGLMKCKKEGVNKIMYSEETGERLFSIAQPYMINPIRKKIYVPVEYITEENILGGYTALAEFSMLNSPSLKTYVSDRMLQWKVIASEYLSDATKQVEMEIWKYSPEVLGNGTLPDQLSLALTLKEDLDERVEEAVEQMLKKLWREIDGNRN